MLCNIKSLTSLIKMKKKKNAKHTIVSCSNNNSYKLIEKDDSNISHLKTHEKKRKI